jgi:hypothetical protein
MSKGNCVAVEPELVCPLDTIDPDLAAGSYALVPESPVHLKSVELLRRTLGKTNSAIGSRWTMRSGSRDAIVVIHAGERHLLANRLPFAHQLNVTPTMDASGVKIQPAEETMFE